MTVERRRRWPVLIVLAVVSLLVALPGAGAATAPGAAAEAYGLLVDTVLTPLHLPVQQGPVAWAAQEYPTGAAAPSEAEVLGAGPVPAGGELVQNVRTLASVAQASATPDAVAVSQAGDVRLLSVAGVPLITADLVRAEANSGCTNAPNATGTTLVNLRVAGAVDPITAPAPNTELSPQVFNPLGLRVILNEQHPASDGRGIVVNAIHVMNLSSTFVPGLFRGDVIVAHAMSTVSCPDGAGSTGTDSPLKMTKAVAPTSATAGSHLTYTAVFTNTSSDPCVVNEAIDHLPIGFEPVSTAGDLGTASTARARPGGGSDVLLGNGETIAAGASATQTFTVKVGDSVNPGTYFNNVELLCAGLGNFVKGLDAPLTVLGATTTTTGSTTTTTAPTTTTTAPTTTAASTPPGAVVSGSEVSPPAPDARQRGPQRTARTGQPVLALVALALLLIDTGGLVRASVARR